MTEQTTVPSSAPADAVPSEEEPTSRLARLGRRVATYKAKETTMEELVGAMTGAVTQEKQS